MARVAVSEVLALGSNRERAPEERLEGIVPDGIINRILQHRRDAREVPSQLGDFRPRDSGEMLHDVDLAALAPGDAIKVVYEDGTTVLTSVEKTAM